MQNNKTSNRNPVDIKGNKGKSFMMYAAIIHRVLK